MHWLKKCLTLKIATLICVSGFAQKNDIDSLRFKLYTSHTEDSSRVILLNKLAYLSIFRNLDDQKEYCREALLISHRTGFKKGEAEAYRMAGLGKMINQGLPVALNDFHKALAVFSEINDFRGECDVLINISRFYLLKGESRESINLLNLALSIAHKHPYTLGLAKALHEMGEVELHDKHFNLARKDIDSSLKLAAGAKLYQVVIGDYETMGDIEEVGRQPEKARLFYSKAMDLSTSTGNVNKEIVLYAKLGESLEQSKELELAHAAFQKCINLSRTYASSALLARGYLHLARVDSLQTNYREALDHYGNYIRLKDSLEKVNDYRQTLEMQTKFDEERKEKENRYLLAQAGKDKDIIRGQYVGLFLLLAMVTFLIINARKWRRLNMLKAQSLAELQAKNDEINQITKIVTQQKVEEEKINMVKDKLFSVISHDMRAPLTQLKGILNLMEMKALDPDEWQELVPELKKNVSHSTEQLDNLLLWSKNQMHGFNPIPVDFTVFNLAEKSRYMLESASTRKSITVTNLIDPKLMVSADKEMVQIVIRNLLSNAIKFTPLGGFIEITACLDGDTCIITVHDTGVGVKKQDTERIFNELDYTTNGTADEKGTGLGLKLAKDFVQMNKGRLWVEPSKNVGSLFRFSLMLATPVPV